MDKRIGTVVRARRLEIGMSQERLAELLRITFQQVQKYEKGINRIAASRLFDIARALEVPITRFFEAGQRGRGGDGIAVEQALKRADVVELVKMYSSITSVKLRKRALEAVRTMARDRRGDETV